MQVDHFYSKELNQEVKSRTEWNFSVKQSQRILSEIVRHPIARVALSNETLRSTLKFITICKHKIPVNTLYIFMDIVNSHK